MDDLEAETQRADAAEAALARSEEKIDELQGLSKDLEEALRNVRGTLDEIRHSASEAIRDLP